MWRTFIILILWILVLVYNSIYRFLPSNLQAVAWVRGAAMAAATVLLLSGAGDAIRKFRTYSYARVSAKDGSILKQKNFRWKLHKSTAEGNVVYVIEERYGDASEVRIKPDRATKKFEVYNAFDGIGVKFLCPENEIPDFRIEFSK